MQHAPLKPIYFPHGAGERQSLNREHVRQPALCSTAQRRQCKTATYSTGTADRPFLFGSGRAEDGDTTASRQNKTQIAVAQAIADAVPLHARNERRQTAAHEEPERFLWNDASRTCRTRQLGQSTPFMWRTYETVTRYSEKWHGRASQAMKLLRAHRTATVGSEGSIYAVPGRSSDA